VSVGEISSYVDAEVPAPPGFSAGPIAATLHSHLDTPFGLSAVPDITRPLTVDNLPHGREHTSQNLYSDYSTSPHNTCLDFTDLFESELLLGLDPASSDDAHSFLHTETSVPQQTPGLQPPGAFNFGCDDGGASVIV
jgi:hypothetical protein